MPADEPKIVSLLVKDEVKKKLWIAVWGSSLQHLPWQLHESDQSWSLRNGQLVNVEVIVRRKPSEEAMTWSELFWSRKASKNRGWMDDDLIRRDFFLAGLLFAAHGRGKQSRHGRDRHSELHDCGDNSLVWGLPITFHPGGFEKRSKLLQSLIW